MTIHFHNDIHFNSAQRLTNSKTKTTKYSMEEKRESSVVKEPESHEDNKPKQTDPNILDILNSSPEDTVSSCSSDTGSFISVRNLQVAKSAGGTFGEINVQSSSEVHFGNKIYAAPITVVNATEENIEQLEKKDKTTWLQLKQRIIHSSRQERIVAVFFGLLLLILISVAIYFGTKSNPTKDLGSNDTVPLPDVELSDCFRSRKFWKALDPAEEMELLQKPVSMVIILHTAANTCATEIYCIKVMQFLQELFMTRDKMSDIAYNFVVGNDGRVYEGRGENFVGRHTRNFNSQSIGIAFMGNYISSNAHEDISQQQVTCTKHLLAEGVINKWLAENYVIVPHCKLVGGAPPGDLIVNEIQTWEHYADIGNATCDF